MKTNQVTHEHSSSYDPLWWYWWDTATISAKQIEILKVAFVSINSCVCLAFSSRLPFLRSILSSSQDILKRTCVVGLLDTILENSSWPFIRFPAFPLPSLSKNTSTVKPTKFPSYLSSWHFSSLSSGCFIKKPTFAKEHTWRAKHEPH